MNRKSVSYRSADYLETSEDITAYLNVAMEDGDERVLLLALRNVADAMGGMARLASDTGLSRESLYRTLSEKGNPRLSSLVAVLHSMGLELTVKARNPLHST